MNTQSLTELSSLLRDDRLSLFDYLDQLEAYFNLHEPDVLAFVPEEGRFGRLRREAEALRSRYLVPAERPPLFGVPVGVKDIFHVDGLLTQAGSRLPSERLQGTEAASVTALKAAGALILGKTVTTEFASTAPGPTRHPLSAKLGTIYTPGGSSSGSAAAVAAGLCPLALGSQTGGSVIRPAAFCGVVGFKPSFGRIPTAGIIPASPSADHVGYFTSTVTDAAFVAPHLCAGWQHAPLTTHHSPLTLGVPEGPYLERASAEALAHFRAICDRLAEAGYRLCSVSTGLDIDAIYERHDQMVTAEVAQGHQQWYAEFGELYREQTAALIHQGRKVTAEALKAGRESRLQVRQQLTRLMDQHGIDLWLSPAATGTALQGLDSTGDPAMNILWTHAGLPAITIPSGTNELGLPFGLQITGRFMADEQLLEQAASIELALKSKTPYNATP